MAKQENSHKGLWGGVITLSLIGLAFSIHLVYIHVKIYTDASYKSVCAISEKLNCESVALSKYSLFLNVPVAVWGLLAYLLFLGFAFAVLRSSEPKKGLPGLLFLGATAGVISSAILAYISHTIIGALCPSCMVTYAVNPVLWVLAWILIKKQGETLSSSIGSGVKLASQNASIVFILGFVVVVLLMAYPRYWQGAGPFQDREIARGIDHGHSWLGAQKPKVTVVEYTDYLCPHCKIQHVKLRKLLRKNKQTLRIVHRHFPLDHKCHPQINKPFHPNACLFARAAYCAGQQKKFWPMNDILYRDGKKLNRAALFQTAKTLKLKADVFKGCLDSDAANDAVAKDLQAGLKARIQGTPSFFINGKAHTKGDVLEAIQKALDAPNAAPAKAKPRPTARRATTQPASKR